MGDKETYYIVTGHLRTSLDAETLTKSKEAIDAIRTLPFMEEHLQVAICVLGAGLAAEIPLKDIAL